MTLKELWLQDFKEKKLKYFVLKAEDFLNALNDEEIDIFNRMLKKHEMWRVKKGKTEYNQYWVVNRDEPYADQVKKLIFGE